MNLENVRVPLAVPPHPPEQIIAFEGDPRRAHQMREQVKLGAGEVNRGFADGDMSRAVRQHQYAVSQNVSSGREAANGTAATHRHRAQPRRQNAK